MHSANTVRPPEFADTKLDPPTESKVTAGQVLSSLLGISTVTACGGEGSSGSGNNPTAIDVNASQTTPAPLISNSAVSSRQAVRFLNQAQFSASDSEIAALQTLGYSGWLDQQFAAPNTQTAWDWLVMKGFNVIAERNNRTAVENAMWAQLITSTDTLRKRVALALSEILVVSLNGSVPNPPAFAVAAYWDLLVANAFGNYRTLLEAVTLSPAMGGYLNIRGSQKADAKTGRKPDENYGREVMQLFTIGLNQLNLDGTPQLDASGQPLPTYVQDDVVNIARIFTGWDLDGSQGTDVANPLQVKLPMKLNDARHSPEAATFLGVTVPANTDGKSALKITLDALFNHPNVGPFVSKQLIQRLVTSNPSPAYVARVASVFNKNSANVRGDLKAVVRAILLDDEARLDNTLTQNTYGRIREPMLRFVQWARTFNAKPANDNWSLGDLSDPANRLGQSPFRSPTVFNFFRPGYVPPNTEVSKAGLTIPEFQLVNEITVAGYLNFMQRAVSNAGNLIADYSSELALVSNPNALVKRLAFLLSANQVSDATQNSIANAITTIDANSTAGKNNRVYAAVMLILSTSEYLVQK